MSIQILTVESRAVRRELVRRLARRRHRGVRHRPRVRAGPDPRALADNGLTLAAIVCTHGHVDHIAGNADLKRAFPDAPIIIGTGDAAMLTDADAEHERRVRVAT